MEREGEQSHVQHCGLRLGVEFALPAELAPTRAISGMTDHFDVLTRREPANISRAEEKPALGPPDMLSANEVCTMEKC
jgi:hypothetical protein